MKNVVVATLAFLISYGAQATINLEHNMVECPISTNDKYEEIILKEIENTDGDGQESTYYAVDYVGGELDNEITDLLGNHERVRNRLFTSQIAEGEGVVNAGARDYQMIIQFPHSQVIANLTYNGLDENDYATYIMTFDGNGPAFAILMDRLNQKLNESEHYEPHSALECVTHFNLQDFVTQ